MKKKYMTPEVEILDVEIEGSILAAASQNPNYEPGEEEEEPGAREFDGFVFDDDDFEDDDFDDDEVA